MVGESGDACVDLSSFEAFIRGCMRRDPTGVVIGERWDDETMAAAVRAAIEGHVLRTTIHADDVAPTMRRAASSRLLAER